MMKIEFSHQQRKAFQLSPTCSLALGISYRMQVELLQEVKLVERYTKFSSKSLRNVLDFKSWWWWSCEHENHWILLKILLQWLSWRLSALKPKKKLHWVLKQMRNPMFP